MTCCVIQSLRDIAGAYDAIVLDQWGVLHDGTAPYPGAVEALERLHQDGICLAVLSNSGERAAPNEQRIAEIGFAPDLFDCIMTSGEALWRDIYQGHVHQTRFFPIERAVGDAAAWVDGLKISMTDDLGDAQAILLMGLPDGSSVRNWSAVMDQARQRNLTAYCSNPDCSSPRSGGETVVSPGALAHAYQERGGHTVFYGKPHRPVFEALEAALSSRRLLMVGDSLQHDIAGAIGVGWDSVLVKGGLYSADFAAGETDIVLSRLCSETSVGAPTYIIEGLA